MKILILMNNFKKSYKNMNKIMIMNNQKIGYFKIVIIYYKSIRIYWKKIQKKLKKYQQIKIIQNGMIDNLKMKKVNKKYQKKKRKSLQNLSIIKF